MAYYLLKQEVPIAWWYFIALQFVGASKAVRDVFQALATFEHFTNPVIETRVIRLAAEHGLVELTNSAFNLLLVAQVNDHVVEIEAFLGFVRRDHVHRNLAQRHAGIQLVSPVLQAVQIRLTAQNLFVQRRQFRDAVAVFDGLSTVTPAYS
jgi:hypothetical protein